MCECRTQWMLFDSASKKWIHLEHLTLQSHFITRMQFVTDYFLPSSIATITYQSSCSFSFLSNSPFSFTFDLFSRSITLHEIFASGFFSCHTEKKANTRRSSTVERNEIENELKNKKQKKAVWSTILNDIQINVIAVGYPEMHTYSNKMMIIQWYAKKNFFCCSLTILLNWICGFCVYSVHPLEEILHRKWYDYCWSSLYLRLPSVPSLSVAVNERYRIKKNETDVKNQQQYQEGL